MKRFHVGNTEAALGLALYVLGYGAGCLLLSPLTEIPSIGRNPPYAISGLLFVLLCVPTALVQNYPGLMVLRFLLGLMASPPLATSGATLGDIWSPKTFPFVIGIWAMTTAFGPALGPTLSSYAVKTLGWRFASWELLIIAGPVYFLLVTTVPETHGLTILYYRAKSPGEKEGETDIETAVHIKTEHVTVSSLLWDALIKPWEMNVKDPALLFTTLYFGLIYGIYYTFFEVSCMSDNSYWFCITHLSSVVAPCLPSELWFLACQHWSRLPWYHPRRLPCPCFALYLPKTCVPEASKRILRRAGGFAHSRYGFQLAHSGGSLFVW